MKLSNLINLINMDAMAGELNCIEFYHVKKIRTVNSTYSLEKVS